MKRITTENKPRYEILTLNPNGPSVYRNPCVGRTEPICAFYVMFQTNDDECVQVISSEKGDTRIVLVLGSHEVCGVYTQDAEVTLDESALLLSDRKATVFTGKMIVLVQLSDQNHVLWFVDATKGPVKVASAWSNFWNLDEFQAFTTHLCHSFAKKKDKLVDEMLLYLTSPEEENEEE